MDVLFILRMGYHLKIYNSLLYVLVRNLFVIDFKVIIRTSIELGHPCFSWLYYMHVYALGQAGIARFTIGFTIPRQQLEM